MELFPRTAILDWASALLTTYAARDAIVVTHNYMYPDETRQRDPDDDYGPVVHSIGGADGEGVWAMLRQHDNVALVVSGHQLQDGTGKRIDSTNGGHSTWQILCNYQFGVTGGNHGELRLYTIKPHANRLVAKTLSVNDGTYRLEADQQFTVSYRATRGLRY